MEASSVRIVHHYLPLIPLLNAVHIDFHGEQSAYNEAMKELVSSMKLNIKTLDQAFRWYLMV